MKHASSSLVYLKGVSSASYRSKVQRVFREKMGKAGVENPRITSRLNNAKREILHDAIFEVENHLESQRGGQPDHPTVTQLRGARNLVLDDLGWNEYPEDYQHRF